FQSIVGSLIYIVFGTKLNIVFAILIISQYTINLVKAYFRTFKRIFKYLKGTQSL
ncbi:hypothetical protein NEUTE1DRAFT_14510, partial [Neurospora tetrasperma FGSC 2508]